MDIVSYILSKKYTDQTVDGLGAIKGAPCTVQSIVDITDGKRVTLAWESNSGVEQTQSFDIMNGEDGANTVEWNQIQQSGTKIAEVVINGSTTNVYAPNDGGGSGGGHTIIDPAGNDMDQEDGLQFTGNVAVSDDSENSKTVINIPQEVVSLTQAQYNALPSSKLTDGKIYCISDSVGGVDGYPPLIYSDDEREVGVWTDGNPLYQITVDQTIGSDADYTVFANGIDHAYLVNSCFEYSSGRWMSFDYISLGATSNNRTCYVDVQNGALKLHNQTNQSLHWIATIQYTKTTDTPGSGTWTTYGSYAHHYSTDEHVIGTWIDGKPLYEKTWNDLNVTATTAWLQLTDVSIPNVSNVINCKLFRESTDTAGVLVTMQISEYGVNDPDFTCLQVKVDSESAGKKIKIAVVQYTKSTD